MKKNIIPLILLLLLSCGNEKRLTLLTDGNEMLDSCIRANDFTIICYIDSADCTFCSIQWLDFWTYRESELEKLKTGIVLIVDNTDEEEVYDALSLLQRKYPVVFDKSSTLKKNNAFILNQYSVFAVNKEKEAVWLDSPIENENTWNLFSKKLRRLSRPK